jgi:apolipoprotein N-acyltransferase
LALALAIAAAAIYGARFAIAAFVERRSVANGFPEGLGLVLGFVTGEFALAGPMPWYLGTTVHQALPLIQVADLFGPTTASAAVVIAGLTIRAIVRLVSERTGWNTLATSKRSQPGAIGWGLASAAVLAYGLWRVSSTASASSEQAVRVGIVQPNVHPAAIRDERSAVLAVRDEVLSTWRLADRGAALVIWPETAVRVAIPAEEVRALYPRLFTRDLRVPTVLGASLGAPGDHHLYNAAVSVDGHGAVLDIYKKRRLAPFAEDFPGRDRLHTLTALFPAARVSAGDRPNDTLTVLAYRASIFICYEVLFPSAVRDSVTRHGSSLILSIANDGWLGDTWAPWMHLAAAKLRAVENRRYLVRAAGTGISAIVDPSGRVRAQTGPVSRAELLGAFYWSSDGTLYQHVGDGAAWIAAAAAAWISFRDRTVRDGLRSVRTRRSRRKEDS